MFEKASRSKLRFRSPVGSLTTEDLWDLPLTSKRGLSLDHIAKTVNKELKESEEESFVQPSKVSNDLSDKLNLVKHIIKIRLDDQEKAEQKVLNKNKKQQILEIIDSKESETLQGKSLEELKKMVEDL